MRASHPIVAAALLAAILAVACTGWPGRAPVLPAAPPFDAAAIAADIAWLADDAREGRGVGSAGLDQAAAYVAEGFRDAGLAPGGDAGSFLKSFEMQVSTQVAAASLRVGELEFERGRDFDAFVTSESGHIEADIVFAGYGISAADQGYDDYAELDVEGKIALVLSDRPAGDEAPFSGRTGASFLRRHYKFANAKKHGAAAVVLVPSLRDADGLAGNAGQESANPTTQPGGVVAVGLSRAAAERIVTHAGGSLADRQRQIDATGQPASGPLPGLRGTISVDVARRRGSVANVIGVWEGSDPELRREVVVVGAHYDHLGRGEFGSLPSRPGEIHNGADDNASGTAGLMALARAFGQQPRARRTLVLVAFTGEEAGLVGSAEYVRDPAYPIEDSVAMINLDMIGRLGDRKLIVFGVETSGGFSALVRGAARGVALDVEPTEGGYSASDQTSFYARDVPVLFFFTGSHTEYHSPDDDSDLIDAAGTAKLLEVVYRSVRELLDADERPRVIAAKPPERGSGGAGGYGPYLGTIPDFGGSAERGVLLQGVRAQSPADSAGIRSGDRIVGFDGAGVANLEEYAALLYSSRPGQRVEVVAIREGKRLTFEVTLGQRR